MSNCLFCEIAKKDVPADVIYEDESALAVLDVHPLAPGHAMVLSKVHAENILDLPETRVGPLFLAVRNVTGLLKRALAPDGFTIGINHGKDAGQAVGHLHIHVIPRYKDDGGTSIHGVVNNPPTESLAEIKSKILNATAPDIAFGEVKGGRES